MYYIMAYSLFFCAPGKLSIRYLRNKSKKLIDCQTCDLAKAFDAAQFHGTASWAPFMILHYGALS